MLSRMISDTWHHQQTSDSDSDDKSMFIDRSGDIFQHVLEYLRYGSVVLPLSIPTEMFTRDLEYYLLEYDVSTITDGEERYAAQMKEHAALKKKHAQLKKKHDHLDKELNHMIASKLIADANQRMREATERLRQAMQGDLLDELIRNYGEL